MGGDLRNIALRTGEWIIELEELSKKREEIHEKLETLRREDDNVKRQLKDLPLQEIAELEKKRSRFQRNLELYLQEKGGLERTLEGIDAQIESLRKEIRKTEEKQVELLLLSRKEDLAQRATDALSNMKQEFIEETRKSVEKSTKDVFDQLAWKQDQFQDIKISGDFRMEIIDRYGLPTRRELSAGERQVLSLSFICAMARIAGEEAPLVMDTPFGRLSKNHLKAVAEHLPDLAPQLVLFVTDSEWSNASSSHLETRVGEQYELQFEDGCTTIREVDW